MGTFFTFSWPLPDPLPPQCRPAGLLVPDRSRDPKALSGTGEAEAGSQGLWVLKWALLSRRVVGPAWRAAARTE